MKRLTCEMCGSTDLIKDSGVFVCQSCGCKYTVEEARKLMIDGVVQVKGTVEVDESKRIDNLVANLTRLYDSRKYSEAYDTCSDILKIDATNRDALVYSVLSEAHLSCENLDWNPIEFANSLGKAMQDYPSQDDELPDLVDTFLLFIAQAVSIGKIHTMFCKNLSIKLQSELIKNTFTISPSNGHDAKRTIDGVAIKADFNKAEAHAKRGFNASHLAEFLADTEVAKQPQFLAKLEDIDAIELKWDIEKIQKKTALNKWKEERPDDYEAALSEVKELSTKLLLARYEKRKAFESAVLLAKAVSVFRSKESITGLFAKRKLAELDRQIEDLVSSACFEPSGTVDSLSELLNLLDATLENYSSFKRKCFEISFSYIELKEKLVERVDLNEGRYVCDYQNLVAILPNDRITVFRMDKLEDSRKRFKASTAIRIIAETANNPARSTALTNAAPKGEPMVKADALYLKEIIEGELGGRVYLE